MLSSGEGREGERRGGRDRKGVGGEKREGQDGEGGERKWRKEGTKTSHIFSCCQDDRCLKGMHLWPSLMQGSSLKVSDHTLLGKHVTFNKLSVCTVTYLYVYSIGSGGGGSEGTSGGGRVSLSGPWGLGTDGGHSNMTHTHTHSHTHMHLTLPQYGNILQEFMNMIILWQLIIANPSYHKVTLLPTLPTFGQSHRYTAYIWPIRVSDILQSHALLATQCISANTPSSDVTQSHRVMQHLTDDWVDKICMLNIKVIYELMLQLSCIYGEHHHQI